LTHSIRLSVTALILLAMARILSGFSIGSVQFMATNEFITRYNDVAGDKFQYHELFSLSASLKNWSLGLSLRGFNYYKQTPNTTLDGLNTDIYRFYIRFQRAQWKLNAGDFYSLLGRGLVLSVLKNEDVLRERSITGGDAEYHRGKFDFRVLGGIVGDETEDQKWALAGGEARLEWVKRNHIGFHFSYINDLDSRLRLGPRITYSASLHGDRFLKYISYYVELAKLDFLEKASPAEDGTGIYASLTVNHARWTCLAEYKNYRDFSNEMNNPPVADLDEEISPLADAEGIRLQVQYALFNPDLRFVINHGQYREYEDRGNHTYGGLIVEDLWDRLDLSISYGIKNILYPIKKFKFDMIVQISGRWSLEVSVRDKHYRDSEFVFKERDHSLQVSLAPLLSVYVLHQYSHNRIMNLNHFFSGGMQLTLKGRTVFELSFGTVRGGQMCSAGQCFVVPPFKGVKLSLLHIFR
jgi:hypothetical protein